MTWCSRMRVGRIIPRLSSPMVKYHEEYTLRAQVGALRTLELLSRYSDIFVVTTSD